MWARFERTIDVCVLYVFKRTTATPSPPGRNAQWVVGDTRKTEVGQPSFGRSFERRQPFAIRNPVPIVRPNRFAHHALDAVAEIPKRSERLNSFHNEREAPSPGTRNDDNNVCSGHNGLHVRIPTAQFACESDIMPSVVAVPVVCWWRYWCW